MRNELEGKAAVVTGGTSGIGRAVAEALAGAGARVVVAGRDAARGEAAAAGITGARFVRTDVRRGAEVRALFEKVAAELGGVDVLVNAAGIEGPLGPVTGVSEDECDDLLGTNLKGALLCLQQALPSMSARGGGVVVNLASTIGTLVPFAHGIVYGATKAALVSATAATAAGHGEQGVRAYAVCPWITDTPMIDRLTNHDAAAKTGFGGMNPSGRIVLAEEVAAVVRSLAVDGGGFANGSALVIDAGGVVQPLAPVAVLAAAPAVEA